MSSAFERTRDLSCQLPLVAVEDRNGHTVRFLYDDRGRLRHIVDSGGRIWELVYEPDSARIAELIGPDPGADTKRIVYARLRTALCQLKAWQDTADGRLAWYAVSSPGGPPAFSIPGVLAPAQYFDGAFRRSRRLLNEQRLPEREAFTCSAGS